MSNTPVLGLPEIAEGVASQTVLHNQALRLIEARIVRVLSRTTAAPPGSPAEGDSYIVPAGATGAWSGLTNQVASFVGGGWVYLTPGEGVRLWVNDADETVVFDGAAWVLSEGSAGGSGDVVGPASSTDGHLVQFDGATGKLLKDGITLDTDGTLAANSDAAVASQKAVKTYVTASAGGSPTSITGTTGATGGNAVSTGGTSTTSATAGGESRMVGGTPGATGAGGIARITGGAGGTTSGTGGAVIVAGGAPTDGIGGAVNLTGGAGVSPTVARLGGGVVIAGGTGSNGPAFSAGEGGAVSITGGVGGASTSPAKGGNVTIAGGAGGATSGQGGVVSITGGAAQGGSSGAHVTITGGSPTGAGQGGNVTITSGTGASGAGGTASLLGGNAGNGVGGPVVISAGASTGFSSGPTLTITGGAGGTQLTGGVGGALTITAGAGGGTASAGAIATLRGGPGGGSGAGGAVNVTGGTPGATGNAGAVTIAGGTPVAGDGAAVNITASAGVGTNKAGGNVVLRPGTATGSGNPGNIQLDGGRGAALATTATGGFVTLPTCAGTPTGTPVNVPTGSVAMVADTSASKLCLFIGGAWKSYVNLDEAQNTTNRIINGKMAIDQRNAGAVLNVVSPAYTLDRWTAYIQTGPGRFNVARSTGFPRAGAFALTATGTVTDAAPAANAIYMVGQHIEGTNIADFGFGAAGASSFTAAFEVLSSVAGTFPVSFREGGGSRTYVTTFTVAANVFTTVTVTVPGDVTGTWVTDSTATGLSVFIALAAGTTYQTSANTWMAGNFVSVAGCTNLMATASAFMRLSNVRLYKGSVDFGPDRRLYAEELALCQRYYCSTFDQSVAPAPGLGFSHAIWGKSAGVTCEPAITWMFPVTMRATPTVTLYNPRAGGAAGQWSQGTADTTNARSLAGNATRVLIDNSDINAPDAAKFAICAAASAEL